MALLHQARLSPSKPELLAGWLPRRPWYRGPASPDVRPVASCRFDDPAGAVGIETIVLRAGDGPPLHVPLTYRGAPLDGGDAWLLGTTEHSVLGRRWVYDACGDPVYAAVLAATILAGGGEAEELVAVDGRHERRQPTLSVRGSGAAGGDLRTVEAVSGVDDGDPTIIHTDSLDLIVSRVIEDIAGRPDAGDAPVLTAVWTGRSAPALLVRVPARADAR